MATLKVNEIYSSIQGEGPNAYKPTTFVRFGGCNLRCPGWGRGQLPDGVWVDGCDTIHAVYPEFRHEWKSMEPGEILDHIDPTIQLVCFTGGEPLIQPKSKLHDLAMLIYERGQVIEMFTNGTQILPEWINQGRSYIIMDYKLNGSGEHGHFNNLNLGLLRPQDVIKFVCLDTDDIEQAVEVQTWMKKYTKAQFSMGVVWDTPFISEGELATIVTRELTEVDLNIQLHKHIWDPSERKR